jgi:hypothetical protein
VTLNEGKRSDKIVSIDDGNDDGVHSHDSEAHRHDRSWVMSDDLERG